MNTFFEQSRSHWVRYERYEIKTGKDGKKYITPAKDARPDVYNPLKEAPDIVLDALNVGMLMMNGKKSSEPEVEKAILEFITHYGLLGLMTALPTTPSFMDYEAVYLPKNHFIKEETMETEKYLSLFYPFDKLCRHRRNCQRKHQFPQRCTSESFVSVIHLYRCLSLAYSFVYFFSYILTLV